MKHFLIAFRILLVLFSIVMLMDGIAGVLQVEDGKKAFDQLGYPHYLMTIVGVTKILGVIGLWMPNRTIREWAFAGFTFNLIGASASWALSGGLLLYAFMPLILLMVLGVLYILWQKSVPAAA